MFTSPQDAVPATPFALILVAVTALLAPDLDQYRSGIATQQSATCNACGAVEMVREIGFRAESTGHARASESVLGYRMGGGGGEGFVVLLGAMAGARAAARVFEVDVRFDDGELRTFRYGEAPAWRLGDRVRVIQGRVVRLS
jgi:hypothetical protein